MASIYTNLQLSVEAAVTGLGLKDLRGNTVPVNRRQLPRASETLDPLPQIIIAPSDRVETITYADSENTIWKKYWIYVAGIGAGNRTFADMTGPDEFFAWQQAIGLLYMGPPPVGVSQAWNCEFVPEVPLDMAALNKAYLYTAMLIKPWTNEPRS